MHDEHYRKSRVQQSPTDTITEPVKLSRGQDDPYHPKKSTSNKEEVLGGNLIYPTISLKAPYVANIVVNSLAGNCHRHNTV